MKIIISPAKSLDFQTKAPTELYSNSLFLEQAKQLNYRLRGMSVKELSELMKISDSLGQLNFERNQSWELPFSLNNAKQAVYAFTGDVYKGLDVNSITENNVSKLQEKLRILSGLYGVLKPLDLIQPYRLEMGTKLSFPDFKTKNLYEFWSDFLVNALNDEMEEGEVLVDLASKEYSKAIPKKKLKGQLVTPVFKELKGDVYKVVGIYAKRARGLMTRFIIESDSETVDDLKRFSIDGYAYTEKLSTASELVFTR